MLAMRTGIAPSQWLAEPPEVLDTALDLLEDEASRYPASGAPPGSDRPVDPRLSSDTDPAGWEVTDDGGHDQRHDQG